MRREGAPKERELLCGRLIDRPIRPLFPAGFYNEVQVWFTNCAMITIYYNQGCNSDGLGPGPTQHYLQTAPITPTTTDQLEKYEFEKIFQLCFAGFSYFLSDKKKRKHKVVNVPE